MTVINLYSSIYCLKTNEINGDKPLFMRKDYLSSYERTKLDLFESDSAALEWINKEKEKTVSNKGSKTMLEKLTPHKISLNDFAQIMHKYNKIDSVTFLDNNGVCRLYFRADFENNFLTFPSLVRSISPTEQMYVLSRQRKLKNGSILQKEYYFITYPEIATPLLSLNLESWVSELLEQKSDQGYYIETTNLKNIYQRAILDKSDNQMFLLSREEGPHYLLELSDLKKIVEESYVYI